MNAAPPVRAAFDGKTGQACVTNADCHAQGGPARDVCSNDPQYAVDLTAVRVSLWPTPVCLLPRPDGGAEGDCDPGIDPNVVHFCDGPDTPASGGLCVAIDSPPQSGRGICYPKCTFAIGGGAASGCAGNDRCTFYANVVDNAGISGIGFCQGACAVDSDCKLLGPSFSCQQDIGFCTTAPVVRTKSLGAECSAHDTATGACNCNVGASGNGYCTAACASGVEGCPPGWVCDTGQPASIVVPGQSGTSTVQRSAAGLVGTCMPGCGTPLDGGVASDGGVVAPADSGVADAPATSSDGDVASEAGVAPDDARADALPEASPSAAACPPNSTCVSGSAAGPDCVPQ